MNRFIEYAVTLFVFLSGIVLVVVMGILITFLLYKGGPSINLSLIFGETRPLDGLLLKKEVYGGLFPAIVGTILLIITSIIWAIPIGVASGIYLAEYCNHRWKFLFNFLLDILAGIPSIVVGLFGFSVSVFLHKYVSKDIYPCFLISSLALACLVLPYIIRTTEQSLIHLPFPIRTTGLVLGVSQLKNIVFILIPYNLSRILSGIILAIGRCAEDTAVIMLTGVVAMAGIPTSLLSKYEALPFYIFHISSEFTNQEELMTGFGASLILLTICVFLLTFSRFLKKRMTSWFEISV
ncbi:MAG: ABC transporter permease subunit [Thermodesulfobacteriota bacterium]|nr:ABC transporter permease subunit [Thermodesulfobacteriota bacterium]